MILFWLVACTTPPPAPEPAPPAAPSTVEGVRLPDPATIGLTTIGLLNGDYATELDLTDLRTGKPWKLSDRLGAHAANPAKAAIVSFSASWCGPCKQSLPHLANLERQHGDDLQVVIVNIDEHERGRKEEVRQVEAAGLTAPVLKASGDVIRAWLGQRRNIPHLYICNTIGEILVQDRGFGPNAQRALPKQVQYAIKHPEYVDRSKANKR